MAIYEYKALNSSGKNVKGYVEASYTDTALEKLKSRGLYIQNINEVKQQQEKKVVLFASLRKRNATSYITRQLSFLVGASVPVVTALEALSEQLEDGHLKKMMIDIKEKIKEGKSVSQAFSEYPDYFNRMYTSSLHAGELSGSLDVVLERLSQMYEKNQALIAKLRSSLTYPLVMLLFGLMVVVFLVTFIVPTFAGVFAEFGQTLP
ncbi:MAG: type II secretion system F family protein, partial [Spirochaetota bacterium]